MWSLRLSHSGFARDIALRVASEKFCADVELLSVCGTNSNKPLDIWEDVDHIPEGGITLSTTSPVSVMQMLTQLSATLANVERATRFNTAGLVREVAARVLSVAISAADLHGPAGATTFGRPASLQTGVI